MSWLVVVKTKLQDLYDVPEEATHVACQENDDIGSIPFAFNTLDNDQNKTFKT